MPELDDFSRFQSTTQILVDGVVTFGRWQAPQFLVERPADADIGVLQITANLEGRPDIIANNIYGTPLLDWVLIAFNNARGVFNWPRAGAVIEYPLERIVLPQLLR